MHSKEYEDARKEFWNCIFMSPVCLGVSLILAFTTWKPLMAAELRRESLAHQA